MEIESIIIYLFTISRIDKILGKNALAKKLDNQYFPVMQYLIRDVFHKKLPELKEFINNNPKYIRFTKLTMLLKSLSYNREVFDDNFQPYIKDTINEILSLANSILNSVDPES
jgi:hypothetical protein